MLLFASKLFVAWWITLMSAVGVWLPIFYVRRSREDFSTSSGGAFARLKRPPLGTSATTKWCLSLANCVSAGMLLTMALLHFFPEAFEADSTAAVPPATPLCGWMLVGILIPAVLERSMKGGGGHGHSHGVASEADGDHAHGDSSSGSGGAVSTATLLIILMCFHGMTEGLLLGFENKIAALLSAALPLSIHKFCDGLVIGVATAKELSTQTGDESPVVDGDGGGRSATRFWRRLYQGPVGAWLLLTPITMVGVVLLAPSAASGGVGPTSVTNFTTLKIQTAAEVLSAVPSSAAVAATSSAVSTLAAVQAMGSGSFIYIGLGILHSEELKGASANAALLAGVALTGSLFLLSSGSH